MRKSLILLVAAALTAGAISAQGAPIVFTAANDTADTDVSTAGTLVAAFNVGGAATTINTVPFAAFPVSGATATSGNTTVATASGSITNPGSAYGTPTSGSISANYASLLNSGAYEDTTPAQTFTITFTGLTAGQTYQFQFWVNDSRGPAAGGFRTETLSGPTGSNTVTLSYDVGNVSGGVGQYALGTFVADGASQSITVLGNNNDTQINGFQLRAVPEPTSLGLLAVGALALLGRRRKVL